VELPDRLAAIPSLSSKVSVHILRFLREIWQRFDLEQGTPPVTA
jgi:hypothetical protein